MGVGGFGFAFADAPAAALDVSVASERAVSARGGGLRVGHRRGIDAVEATVGRDAARRDVT